MGSMRGAAAGRERFISEISRLPHMSLLSSAASLSSRASVGLNEKAATWWLWRLHVDGGSSPSG